MINFSDTPFQTDSGILSHLMTTSPKMITNLPQSEVDDIIKSVASKSRLVPKKVLVHAKDGKTYWATRMVSPEVSHITPKTSDENLDSSDAFVISRNKLFPQNLISSVNSINNPHQSEQPSSKSKPSSSPHTTKFTIQHVMTKSTPEQQQLYRSTGICAEDKAAEDFIQTIHTVMIDNGVSNPDSQVKAKLSSIAPDSEEYKKIVKSIEASWLKKPTETWMSRLLPRQPKLYKIHGIYKIDELAGEQNFQDIVKSNSKYATATCGNKNCQLDTFFHGTSTLRIGQILGVSGKFKIFPKAKTGSMLGRAMYLAENANKSAGYMETTNSGFVKNSNYHSRGGFLVCEASLGNALHIQGRPTSWNSEMEQDVKSKYNSVYLSNKTFGSEFAVYDENAVIPRYVVDMEVVYT